MKKKENFDQVCVWAGTIVGGKKEQKDFVSFMKNKFGVRVQYLEEIKTGPDFKNGHPVEETGGRNDLFFAVHTDDVVKFAIPRLSFGIRWVEDVLNNECGISIYPERVTNYRTW